MTFGQGLAQGGINDVLRHAVQVGKLRVVGKGFGGVQGVFAEFLAQLRLALLNLGKAHAVLALQLGARQHKVAHGVFMSLALLGVQAADVNGFVLGVQALVGAQPGPELSDTRQGGVVGGTQFRCVGHAVEVADGAPGAAEVFGGDVQHPRDAGPTGRETGLGDFAQSRFGTGQQFIHGGADMLGFDLVKQRERGGGKQGVGHGV